MKTPDSTPDTNQEGSDVGRWVTIPEACAYFQRNERTIRRWIKSGEIHHKNERGRALVLIYNLPDKGPDPAGQRPDIEPDSYRPGPDITPAELARLKAEVEKLEALLSQKLEENNRLWAALEREQFNLAAAQQRLIEAQASQSDPSESKMLSRPWWKFWG